MDLNQHNNKSKLKTQEDDDDELLLLSSSSSKSQPLSSSTSSKSKSQELLTTNKILNDKVKIQPASSSNKMQNHDDPNILIIDEKRNKLSALGKCKLAETENTIISSTPDLYDPNSEVCTKKLMPSRRNAVLVQHGYKNYGPHTILNDFNMNVEENTIYGLLGSSGCGKTTILSCIVALRKLDAGNIWISGKPTGTKASGIPGKKVGYMPQEIALNGEFKVIEVLQYFGRIYGMSQSLIKARHQYIIKLLSLEKCKGLIRNLSDGQKRRVSLAVALLHEPDILILDEPTVGCDPLLRQSIWKFLTELVSQKRVTVIVTTHYIEETRQADRVGIMRNGRLLVEDSPTQLLILYNASLLDDIVLKLCQKDEINEDEQYEAEQKLRKNSLQNFLTRRFSHSHAVGSPAKQIYPITSTTTTSQQQQHEQQQQQELLNHNNKNINNGNGGPTNKLCSDSNDDIDYKRIQTTVWNRLRALAVKNIIVLIRNFWFLLFLIILPCTTVIIFCLAVGSDPIDLEVGVINNEVFSRITIVNGTTKTTNNTRTAEICQIEEPISCLNKNLSCLFLDSLNKQQIKLIPFDNINDATDQVRQRKLWGYIVFEPEFSKYIFSRLLLGKRNNITIRRSTIKIKLDMSNPGVGVTIKKNMFDGFKFFTTRLLESCSIDPAGRDLPLTFETPIYGSDETSHTDFMAPGISLGMVFFMGALTCGLIYIIEKKDGMINRTLVTGVSTVEIMLSHFMVQSMVVVVQVIFALFIMLTVFNISSHGSIFLAFFVLLLSSISGMSLGFLASTFCNEEKNAMLVAMGTVFPSFLLSGLIWPIESAPRAIQYISFLFPGTMIAEAFRSVLLRGFEMTHPVIWQGIIAGVVWTIVYWVITVCWHRFIHRRN